MSDTLKSSVCRFTTINTSNMLNLIAPIAKALVPTVVSVILIILGQFGVTPEMTLEQVVTLAVTSVLVYLIPNKKV